MGTQVPVEGEYGVPTGQKDEHCSMCVETLEVGQQSLRGREGVSEEYHDDLASYLDQLKGEVFLAHLGHGVLSLQTVDARVTHQVQVLLQPSHDSHVTLT